MNNERNCDGLLVVSSGSPHIRMLHCSLSCYRSSSISISMVTTQPIHRRAHENYIVSQLDRCYLVSLGIRVSAFSMALSLSRNCLMIESKFVSACFVLFHLVSDLKPAILCCTTAKPRPGAQHPCKNRKARRWLHFKACDGQSKFWKIKPYQHLTD